MKPNAQLIKSIATAESLVHLITCVSASVRNPERNSQARDIATEQKVVASIRKHVAKHQPVEN